MNRDLGLDLGHRQACILAIGKGLGKTVRALRALFGEPGAGLFESVLDFTALGVGAPAPQGAHRGVAVPRRRRQSRRAGGRAIGGTHSAFSRSSNT